MAKANLTLPNGTKVLIEGTAGEVAILLAKFSRPAGMEPQQRRPKHKRKSNRSSTRGTKKARKGPVGLIKELAEEGYFKTKRKLPDVQKKLEERGHIYAQTSLSPALLNLTKKKVVRRLREKKGWVYVQT